MTSLPTAISTKPLQTAPPSRVRYGVLGFACALSMITYLDRACFGTVTLFIRREFDLDPAQIGYIMTAFLIAYASFEVPSGWLGDVFGPRKTLIRIVLWWSAFTAITGIIYPSDSIITLGSLSIGVPFLLLLIVRFLFGMGEAGAYPNIARAFHNWFPYEERGFAKGAVWMSGRFAGGVTPLIVLLLVSDQTIDGVKITHWRHTFWIFGCIGVLWCFFFWLWFRDRPEEKAGVNAAELALIQRGGAGHGQEAVQVPWGKLLRSGNLWLICFMYFCSSFGWYFNINYLPSFLEDRFGLTGKGEAKWSSDWWTFTLLAGLPLLFGSAACLIGGLLTDGFIKRTGNRKWGRRLFGIVGHGLCGVCYFAGLAIMLHAAESPNPKDYAILFTFTIAMAAFFNDLTMGASWASCLDIGGKFSGIVAGCMNTIGNLGGAAATVGTGLVMNYYTKDFVKGTAEYQAGDLMGWKVNFIMFSLAYVAAVILWLWFDATKPVAPEAVLDE